MALPSCRCVGAYPNWKILGPIVAAARTWAGESPDLHCFDNRPIIDQLRGLYCATLTVSGGGGGGGGATLLASFYIPEIVDSLERSIAAGFTGDGDPETFQREAAVDVLRDDHYQGGIDGQLVILEDVPTECVLVATDDINVTPGILEFDAAWNAIPVTVSLGEYQYQIDSDGWVSNGVSLVLSGISASAGTHTLSVRAMSDSGVAGEVATSPEFEIEPPAGPTYYGNLPIEDATAGDTNGAAWFERVTCGMDGTCTEVLVGVFTANSSGGKVAVWSLDGLTLLGSGTTASAGVSGEGLPVSIDVPFSVSNATQYWLGWLPNPAFPGGPQIGFANDGSSETIIDFTQVYASFPTAIIATTSNTTFNASLLMGVVP